MKQARFSLIIAFVPQINPALLTSVIANSTHAVTSFLEQKFVPLLSNWTVSRCIRIWICLVDERLTIAHTVFSGMNQTGCMIHGSACCLVSIVVHHLQMRFRSFHVLQYYNPDWSTRAKKYHFSLGRTILDYALTTLLEKENVE